MTASRTDWAYYGVFLLSVLLFSAGFAGYAMAGLAAVLLLELVTGRLRWPRTSLDRPIVLLVGAALASGVASEWRGEAIALAALLGLTLAVTVYATLRVIRVDEARLRTIVSVWIAGALGAAVWGIARAGEWPERASTPALLATALGTTLGVAAVLALGAWTVTRRRDARLAIVLGLPVLVAALELTASRGAWIATAVGMATLMALAPRGRLALAALVVMSVGVATLGIGRDRATVLMRLESIPSIEANTDRWALWTAAARIVRDHPLLGTGYGTFTRVWPRYRPADVVVDKPTAHNVFLNFAAETGLVGLAAFLLVVGTGLTGLWGRIAAGRGDPSTDGLWVAVFAATVTILVHQCFDGTIMSWHTGFGFVALLGLGAGYSSTPA